MTEIVCLTIACIAIAFAIAVYWIYGALKALADSIDETHEPED